MPSAAPLSHRVTPAGWGLCRPCLPCSTHAETPGLQSWKYGGQWFSRLGKLLGVRTHVSVGQAKIVLLLDLGKRGAGHVTPTCHKHRDDQLLEEHDASVTRDAVLHAGLALPQVQPSFRPQQDTWLSCPAAQILSRFAW